MPKTDNHKHTNPSITADGSETDTVPKSLFEAEKVVIYLHGKGGSADEAAHYRPLFPEARVIGLDYCATTPWEAAEELPQLYDAACRDADRVTLIANSLGAFFAMCALSERKIETAFFISPVVDMEKLIETMMKWANVDEHTLRRRGEIETAFGQTLSWEYLCYVRQHPITWKVPTHILYGSEDNLTSFSSIQAFAAEEGASLTVMEGGEHWFHTEAQMRFLDRWLLSYRNG